MEEVKTIEELQEELKDQRNYTNMYRDKWQRAEEAIAYHAKNAKILMGIVKAQAELINGLYNGKYGEDGK